MRLKAVLLAIVGALSGLVCGALIGMFVCALAGAIVPSVAAMANAIPPCANFGAATVAMLAPAPSAKLLGDAAAAGILGLLTGAFVGTIFGLFRQLYRADLALDDFMTREEAALEAERRIERCR